MSNPLVVRYPDGAEYGVETVADAKKHHPNAKIVRHQNGQLYEEPKPAQRAPSMSKAKGAATRTATKATQPATEPKTAPAADAATGES